MKPSAATAQIARTLQALQEQLTALRAEVTEIHDRLSLNLGLTAAIAEAVNPKVAEASAAAAPALRAHLPRGAAPEGGASEATIRAALGPDAPGAPDKASPNATDQTTPARAKKK